MTYSSDLRRHVLSIRKKEGLTYAETSKRFGIGVASLSRWNNKIEPKAHRDNRPRKIDLKKLRLDVENDPDAYQYERTERFGVHPKSMWSALKKIGISYKKPLHHPKTDEK